MKGSRIAALALHTLPLLALVGACTRYIVVYRGEEAAETRDGGTGDAGVADGDAGSSRDARLTDGQLSDTIGPKTDLTIGGDAPSSIIPTWGAWVASQTLPDCPGGGAVLLVNTSADELDGGDTLDDPGKAGELLSLREALHIAQNRPGRDNILFDPTVFPVDRPTTITLMADAAMPRSLSDICIDGRNRGVIIQ